MPISMGPAPRFSASREATTRLPMWPLCIASVSRVIKVIGFKTVVAKKAGARLLMTAAAPRGDEAASGCVAG